MRRALAFLTPLGGARPPDARMLTWFPVIGAAVGAAVGAAWWGASRVWPPMAAGAIAVAVDLALTGLLHVDGLIDSADGLLPHLTRQRRLEVMAEPTVGAYGVAIGAIGIVLRVGAFAAAEPGAALVAASWCASRTVMAVATSALPYARGDDGLASTMRGARWQPAAAVGGVLTVALAALTGWRAELAAAGCVAVAAIVVGFAHKQLGGFTGDALGAAGFCGETAALLVASVT